MPDFGFDVGPALPGGCATLQKLEEQTGKRTIQPPLAEDVGAKIENYSKNLPELKPDEAAKQWLALLD